MLTISFSRLQTGLAAALLLLGALPMVAQAQPTDYLVKGSSSTVYYNSADGKRYGFPSEAIYKSWYPDFSHVAQITDSELAALPLGGNVTFKPGSTLVKITTDPRVYAVSQYGLLHWVTSESIAAQLYGSDWNKHVMDVPDSLFVNYIVSFEIDSADQYDVAHELTVATPGDNVKPANFVPPPAPAPTTSSTNPGTISVSLSASNSVVNATEGVYASVHNSNLPITKIEIYKESQSSPLMTCLTTTDCSYTFFINTAPLLDTFYAIAYDSAGTKLVMPEATRPMLTVNATSNQVQLSMTPQNIGVGGRASFNSIYSQQEPVQSHRIYALIPGQPISVLWKDCGASQDCSGSTPFYRTTNLYSQVVIGGQTLVSPTVSIIVTGGSPPAPTLTVSGHPMINQETIEVTAPYGETIGETLIKDGTTINGNTLAICNLSSCTITLQVNVPGSITAFTSVGGEYVASNTLTVTPQ